jgi:hypothetical protein
MLIPSLLCTKYNTLLRHIGNPNQSMIKINTILERCKAVILNTGNP